MLSNSIPFWFGMPNCGFLKHVLFFPQIWGHTGWIWGWADMLSVHVYAVQTHCSLFAYLLENGAMKSLLWAHFEAFVCSKSVFCGNKRGVNNCFKKSSPPDAKRILSPSPEAPREAALRARCSNKKQLLEKQLRHCPRCLQEKKEETINFCEILIGSLNYCKHVE